MSVRVSATSRMRNRFDPSKHTQPDRPVQSCTDIVHVFPSGQKTCVCGRKQL